MTRKILFVDDEPNILNAYKRKLRRQFTIETALDGRMGLDAIEKEGPFAVIVSDMQMPGMNGVEFLQRARARSPDSVRMMLTGNADQETAIAAVNDGHIFRFMTKPCATEVFAKSLQAGIEQYRLITAEKELLEKTLKGSVRILSDVLSLVNPMAFGRASRVRRIAGAIGKHLEARKLWQIEIAAMLSQVGCVVVPQDTLGRFMQGMKLDREERSMLEQHPKIAFDLMANIPRLEEISNIIFYQNKNYDGTGFPDDAAREEQIPLGARILKVALDLDALESLGHSKLKAYNQLKKRQGECYDPAVIHVLKDILSSAATLDANKVAIASPSDLRDGMIIANDVKTAQGVLLVGRGQEVTMSLRKRLINYTRRIDFQGEIEVIIP